MTLYFDTSALVKLVIDEDGSDLATRLWSVPGPAASSILAHPEGRAALASARRGGRLTATGCRTAVEDLATLHDELLIVGIDSGLARHAGQLADEHGLRGYDAVHLAAATALGADTTVVTWGADLGRAAHDVGLAVAPAP